MIGKCNTGGGENLTTQLNNQDAIITELEAKVETVCAIDITPEVTAQVPIIQGIADNFGVEITTPTGTNKEILQGNNVNLESIKTNAKKSGLYVWKKLTAQGGDFVDFVVSDNETAYPDGGEKDGYWYKKFEECKIYSGKITPTSDLTSITIENPFNSAEKVKAVVLVSTVDTRKSKTMTMLYDIVNNVSFTTYGYVSTTSKLINITDDSITFNRGGSSAFISGDLYYWEVIGNE